MDDGEATGQRERPSVVQGRHHLRVARPRVPGQQQRRHRRLPGTHSEARLRPGSRRHLHLAPAVLPVSAARRRLRHLQLSRRAPELRHAGGLSRLPPRGARARPAGADRVGGQSHVGPASLVPVGSARPAGLTRARVLRVERHRPEVPRRPDHLHRHREIELDVGPGREGLLLASILLSPAGPELR